MPTLYILVYIPFIYLYYTYFVLVYYTSLLSYTLTKNIYDAIYMIYSLHCVIHVYMHMCVGNYRS